MSYTLPINRVRKPLIAGVDPDVEKSGLAIWSRTERRWTVLRILTFGEMQEMLTNLGADQVEIVIEAGWKNKGMFKRHKDNLPEGFDDWTLEGKLGYYFQRGVDVGRNHSIGEKLAHYFKANKFEVVEWQPKIEKWDRATLARYTGLTMRTNQDIRDAIRAAFMNR